MIASSTARESSTPPHGVFNGVGGTFSHVKGGAKSEDGPPTPSELRSRLIIDAVQQIAEHLVDSNETVEVFLARKDGPLEEGDKDAMTGPLGARP